jgi:hypothetical protein
VDGERSARMYEGPSILGKTMEPAPDLRVEHPRQIFNGLSLRRCSFQARISARIALPMMSVTAGLKLLTYVPHQFCDRRGRNVYPRTLKPHTPRLTKHATSP